MTTERCNGHYTGALHLPVSERAGAEEILIGVLEVLNGHKDKPLLLHIAALECALRLAKADHEEPITL